VPFLYESDEEESLAREAAHILLRMAYSGNLEAGVIETMAHSRRDDSAETEVGTNPSPPVPAQRRHILKLRVKGPTTAAAAGESRVEGLGEIGGIWCMEGVAGVANANGKAGPKPKKPSPPKREMGVKEEGEEEEADKGVVSRSGRKIKRRKLYG
jgi:hypothetical protein